MSEATGAPERFGQKDSARLEAFSDGVFAFAITLLVLYLKDPVQSASSSVSLLQGLLNQWPSFFAYVTSFATILIMWVGHHEMFSYIVRINRRFMFLNGFLLFFVTLTPFTTSLVSDHILSGDSQTAAVFYSGTFLLLSIAWNILWHDAFHNKKLVGPDAKTQEESNRMQRNLLVGPTVYGLAFLVAFFSGLLSLVLTLAVAIFYAVGTRAPE
jgi:uncharacterized membrane protein